MDRSARLVVHEDPQLHAQLQQLATTPRFVFFAGLPGTGKSLLSHQLAHLAHATGRTVHLLQWDVARPAFEASPAGRPYPLVHGVTHPVIRKAAGLWAREALAEWHQRHPDARHVLIAEIPLVGHRLIELARPAADAAEPLLGGALSRFVIPVPSRGVRSFLEAERRLRRAHPRHPREREDAPPDVLSDLWRELAGIARLLGLATTPIPEGPVPYDPDLYQSVYERVLTHRQPQVLHVTTRLPTRELSVYDFAIPRTDLLPTAGEAAGFIRDVERTYPEMQTLELEVDRWYLS